MKAIIKSALTAFACLYAISNVATAAELSRGLERPWEVNNLQKIHLSELPADTGQSIGQHLKPKDVFNFFATCKEANGQDTKNDPLHLLGIEMMKTASAMHPLKLFWRGEHVHDYKHGNDQKFNETFDSVELLIAFNIGITLAIWHVTTLILLLPNDPPITKPIYGLHNVLYEAFSTYDSAKATLISILYGSVLVLKVINFLEACTKLSIREVIKEGAPFWKKLIERRCTITYDYLWIRSLSFRNTLGFYSPIINKLISLKNKGVLEINLFLENIHPEEFKEIMEYSKINKSIQSTDIKGSHMNNNCELISLNTPKNIFDYFCQYESLARNSFHIKLTRKVATIPTPI